MPSSPEKSGSGRTIADLHYEQVLERDWSDAARRATEEPEAGDEVVQKRAQQNAANFRNGLTQTLADKGSLRMCAGMCRVLQRVKVGVTGLEPVTSAV